MTNSQTKTYMCHYQPNSYWSNHNKQFSSEKLTLLLSGVLRASGPKYIPWYASPLITNLLDHAQCNTIEILQYYNPHSCFHTEKKQLKKSQMSLSVTSLNSPLYVKKALDRHAANIILETLGDVLGFPLVIWDDIK